MLAPRRTITEALASFDRASAREAAADAERERSEVLKLFPLSAWPSMPLERFALGQGNPRETFCWWMEYGTLKMGSILGGGAQKHLIFKRKGTLGWYHDEAYQDERDAWEHVRAAFVRAFELAQQGQWDAIDEIEALEGGAALRVKTLHTYFPDDVIPVFSTTHIRHFLRMLSRPEGDDGSLRAVRLNRALLAALRGTGLFEGFSNKELERFLYAWEDPRQTRRVVKIAPGESARFWDDCLSGGYICVGWDEMGDLREFESKDAFRSAFGERYLSLYNGNKGATTKKGNELWTLMELEPGDVVVANKGQSRVLAVGQVTEPAYEYRPERPEFKHTVRVKWDTRYAKDIPAQGLWGVTTVANVPAELYASIVGSTGGAKPVSPTPPPAPVDPLYSEIASALERKGQVILYGPPGTGKTYAARRFAVWWLLQQDGVSDANAVLGERARFATEERRLSSAGTASRDKQGAASEPAVPRLTRLTFHPSYSYEDFIEGFRPAPTSTGALNLRLEAGVFKRVCREALGQPKQSFLVLIDEINRANVAKVFGELITLLERDKRGLTITLPQSKESFSIPPNVYVLGTMNTADRSIKLLDVALRRRFAFEELMPNTETLVGARVNGLALDAFLEELNRRIAAQEGREKQIGHAYLLEGDRPITDPEVFAQRFRQDILPLLQEYCYEDYATLSKYLGTKLVTDARSLNRDCLAKADELIHALRAELTPPSPGAGA
jgi:5-methylcytosine-specific restriction protein B